MAQGLTAAPDAPQPSQPSAKIGGGPFPAVMEVAPGLPTHTLYRPSDLSKLNGQKLPVVVWGNGACANAGASAQPFLTEIASYGYFVIAVGPIVPPPTATPPAAPPAPGAPRVLPPPATHTPQLIQAIDWASALAKGDGAFAKLVDPTKVAVMGHSCGGVQAIEASADPRVTTAVIWSSGLLPNGTDMAGGRSMTKADLQRMHAPTAYISGDSQDVAFVNAEDDFAKLTKIPVFRAWAHGMPHAGVFGQPLGGEYGEIGVAWLNWRLKGDLKAGKMFVGADCGLCVSPRWVVKRKNL